MSAELLTSAAELPALAEEWESLAERVQASPFRRPGWVTAWWNAFGKGRLELQIARRAQDGRLVGLVPIVRGRGALASPTNWHTPEFGLLSESEEAAGALLAALFRARPRRVSLAFLDCGQAEALRSSAERAGYRVIRRTLQRSPTIALAGDWESYERRLGKNLRSDLKRRQRLLVARGRIALEISAGERLEELLEQGFAVEASGWKGARGTAMRSQPAGRRFYAEVARWAAARGWLRLAFLRLDGRALAFDFCLEHGGVHSMLKTGYDPAYGELSPGKLLRREMIARAFRAGLRSYELLGDDEPWKRAWTADLHEKLLVQGFAPSALGRLDHALFAYGRPLAKRLRGLARGGATDAAVGASRAAVRGAPAPQRSPGEA